MISRGQTVGIKFPSQLSGARFLELKAVQDVKARYSGRRGQISRARQAPVTFRLLLAHGQHQLIYVQWRLLDLGFSRRCFQIHYRSVNGDAAVSHGVRSDSLMSRPSLIELWLGAGTNMKTMPPVDGIWSFAGTSCEALYRGIHFNITSTEEFISISPVQSKCITFGRGKKEERNLGCTFCFPAACSNPHHPFTKNSKNADERC